MKLRTLFSLCMGGFALTALAQGGYQDGVDYYNADRFDKAKTILEKTLNDAGTDKAVSYFYLGSLDMRDGNTAAAATMAAIARAYANVDPVAYAKEIDKYIAQGMKVSKNKEAQIYVLQGDLAKNQDKGVAAGYYEQAMIYDEEAGNVNPEAYVKYSNLYNKVNSDFAIGKLVELNEKLPTSALAQSELAEKYYDNNQFTRAAEQYGKYMQNPNHFQGDEQRYSGLLYFGKKYQESLDMANQVLAKDPNNEYMQRMVMLNKAALEDYAGAEEAAQKLFSHSGAKFTATDYTTHGEVLAKLGRPEEAIVAYEAAYNLNPERNKQVLADISEMYNKLENDAKSVEYMQKFVDSGDASLNDYFILSNRYKNLGLSLPEDSPERAEAANNGIKYIDLALAEAANKDMRMGSFYMNSGDNDKAREYFGKVLEIDPENEPVKEVMKKL
ncbi:MAG: tetratricopeptide repeat protein [Muribaculaceae bacterium]|nr:tetratricopeptide repeat protein [Muribaculaceae bacterium]